MDVETLITAYSLKFCKGKKTLAEAVNPVDTLFEGGFSDD